MENKQISTVRTITGELIGGYILYGIVFDILYNIIYTLISKQITTISITPEIIIIIILQGISTFCIWRCSIATTFKKRTIETKEIRKVIKNLIIFTIILCSISCIMKFNKINNLIEESANKSETLLELYTNQIKEENQIKQYQENQEKNIKETKEKLYKNVAIFEIIITAVYIGVVPLQKKAIQKHAEKT